MDDDSNALASAVALNGVSSLAPGESAVFVEAGTRRSRPSTAAWFGASVPTGVQVGTYERIRRRAQLLGRPGQHLRLGRRPGHRRQLRRRRPRASRFDNAAGSAASPSRRRRSRRSARPASTAPSRPAARPAPRAIVQGPSAGLRRAPPTFPNQPAGTIGPGQWVTRDQHRDRRVGDHAAWRIARGRTTRRRATSWSAPTAAPAIRSRPADLPGPGPLRARVAKTPPRRQPGDCLERRGEPDSSR